MEIAQLKQSLAEIFHAAAARKPIAIRAPGRVNLIGEHTDYNDGFVCPMAIDRSTLIAAAPRDDTMVCMHSLLNHETVEFSIGGEVPKTGVEWSLYAKGSAESIRRRFPRNITRGFDAVIHSTVPLGGGLSSSASFEVATVLTLLTVNHTAMNKPDLALACQWAEHHYPGVPCGIMDPFTSVMGRAGHAMLLDCRDQSMQHVPLDPAALRIVISNSNVKHELTGGEYKERRDQCEAAVRHLQKQFPQVQSLRDVTPEMLEQCRPTMDALVHRRARHIVTEIPRTAEFAASLQSQNYPHCGELMYASHLSMKDDFEISTDELDALVGIAKKVPGVYGARMTGGGFGGCIVALCQITAVEPLTAAIDSQYPQRAAGHHATTFSSVPSEGAHVVTSE